MSEFAPHNTLSRLIHRLSPLPEPLQRRAVGLLFGQYSRYFRSNRLKIARLEPLVVTLSLANHRRVRNHIGGIHAVAITLACEYASGLLVGQHVPDRATVVVKSMHVDLHKAYQGSILATATLTEEEALAIREQPKGELKVPVSVTDATGGHPITGYMQMAWFPRKKR
ncbi:MAG: DUF4442 domain-containing protein [Oleiphilaceae bacterium]|nr:DUF4442 domain-containing protein [Oleiphilaceae bacterium]